MNNFKGIKSIQLGFKRRNIFESLKINKRFIFSNFNSIRWFTVKDRIEEKIKSELSPTNVEVVDLSGNCGQAFQIKVISDQFKGMSIIKQHRLLNTILEEEIKNIHSISYQTSSK